MQMQQLDKQKLERALDVASLGVVLLYVAYKFLKSTTFPFIYNDTFRYVLAPLMLCGCVRVLYFVLRDIRAGNERKDKFSTLGKYVLAGCLALPFVAVALHVDEPGLLAIPPAMACLYRMEPERVLRGYLYTVGPLLAATVLCCLAGCITNIGGWDSSNAYGICNTTDYAAYYLFLMLAVWCTQRTRTWYSIFAFSLLSCLVGAAGNSMASSRTTGICCVLLAAACAWEWLDARVAGKSMLHRLIGKAIDALSVAMFPIMAAITAIITYLVGQGNERALALDVTLSHRIEPTWRVYETYGIQPLGSGFTMHGNGGTVFGSPGTTYDFLDNSYAYIAIRYGAIVFAIVMCLWMWMTVRAVKSEKKRIAFSLAIVALYGFSECHMVNANYNIFLLMPLCALLSPSTVGEIEGNGTEIEKQGGQKNPAEKPWVVHAVLAVVLVLAGFAILPKAMSWLRTFFFVNGWTAGTHTIWALALCLVLVVAVAVMWRTLPYVLLSRTARANRVVAVLAGSIVVLICLALAINSTIDHVLVERSDELDAESAAVQLVLDSASQPVYAVQKSELYQRRFGGLTEHALMTAGIGPGHAGTMLVDKSDESVRLQQFGATYIQLSPTSGIYTFDPAVIEALMAAGFTGQPFYSSERTYDASDIAARNGLALNDEGGVVLDGPDRSINENRHLDQLAGTYEVRLSLAAEPSLLDALQNDVVCIFQVTKNSEDVLFEQPITKTEFDEDGKAEITISYVIELAPHVEHVIIAEADVQISLNEMAWKRVA